VNMQTVTATLNDQPTRMQINHSSPARHGKLQELTVQYIELSRINSTSPVAEQSKTVSLNSKN
jgi:hypothetical protein